MLKNYISKSQLSIRTYNGRRILFEDLSNGGSCFQTSNIELQEEIEMHPMFGRDFDLDQASKNRMAAALANEEVAEKEPAESYDPLKEDMESVPEPAQEEWKEVSVSGLADAKDYLADNYGVLRTQMRTKTAIKEIAEQYHVAFIGL